MKNIAVACQSLQNEVELVAKDLAIKYPIIWMESGLHNFPKKLNKALQEQIDNIENVDNIILLFGGCGNAISGLTSKNAKIIFPKVDDCISLFLGGNEQRRIIDNEAPTYYLTKGYFESESTLWTEYFYCIDRYGAKKAKVIFDKILKNYKKLKIIDTGAYRLEEIWETALKMAKELGLEHEVIKGSLRILYKALKGEWDEEFIILEPGQSVQFYEL